MKKIILIIFMAMISSFSYYGAVNEKGEKVTSFENVVQNQEDIKQDENSNQIEIQEQNEKKEEQLEKDIEQEITQNSDKSTKIENTGNKTQTKSDVIKDTAKQEDTSKNKTQSAKATTNVKKEQTESNKNTENTSKKQTQVTSQNDNIYTEKEVNVAPKTECIGNNHKMSAGNTGKWFETKAQADSYYNTEIEKWGKKWENGEIDKAEYLKKCPSGYEVWTCPQCQKWTINFYYR